MKEALALCLLFSPLCLGEEASTPSPKLSWPWPESTIPAPEGLTNPTGEEEFLETLGPLTSPQGRPDQVRRSSPLIGLYFTSWRCGPCRTFTPALVQITRNNPGLQVIVVSRDRTEEDYKSLRSKTPWPAVPFESGARKALFEKYEVLGVPNLLLFSREGELLDKQGRSTSRNPQALRQLIQKARRL
jgi:hypothetical protein